MDSQSVDPRSTAAPNRVLEAFGVMGVFIVVYLALSAVLEATTSIDVAFVNWPF